MAGERFPKRLPVGRRGEQWKTILSPSVGSKMLRMTTKSLVRLYGSRGRYEWQQVNALDLTVQQSHYIECKAISGSLLGSFWVG